MITKKIIKPAAAATATELPYEEEEESETSPPSQQPAAAKPSVSGGAPTHFANTSDAYNSVTAGGASSELKPGKYEAVVFNAVLEEPSERGQSIRLNFALADEQFGGREMFPSWYKLFNPDQSPNMGGIRAWKDTVTRLGYDSSIPFDEVPQLLETIADDKPGVVINVKYRDWQGRKLMNIFVEGLCDNDVIAQFKEKQAF